MLQSNKYSLQRKIEKAENKTVENKSYSLEMTVVNIYTVFLSMHIYIFFLKKSGLIMNASLIHNLLFPQLIIHNKLSSH